MSVENLDATRKVMDNFLREIAFAMGSSIVGITFSLLLHVFNTIVSPDRMFSTMIDRFESALDLLWYRSDSNKFPDANFAFNEHRDPTEALAEEAIKLETSKTKGAETSYI
jgi:hypothetical protein